MSARRRGQRSHTPPPSPAQDEGLWVRSDVTPLGTYVVTISMGADDTWTLGRQDAMDYVRACVEAAQRAEYDAAVFALLTRRMGLDEKTAITVVVRDVRPDRPPLDIASTTPLSFDPGVNSDGKPFLAIHHHGKTVGQLDPQALRLHALAVLDALAAVDLDAGLYRVLRSMDIPEPTARAAVADVATWRWTP